MQTLHKDIKKDKFVDAFYWIQMWAVILSTEQNCDQSLSVTFCTILFICFSSSFFLEGRRRKEHINYSETRIFYEHNNFDNAKGFV